MVTVVSAKDAMTRRFRTPLPGGAVAWVNSYLGTSASEARARGLRPEAPRDAAPSPVAYLVEQPSRVTVPGHYHQADQFQVFVGGEGTFGNKPIEGIGVHYAAAFTPYAAIAAADGTLEYFTLRTRFDPGPQWMPESREALRAARRSPRAALCAVPSDDGERHARTSDVRTLIAPDGTGLGVWLHVLPEGATTTGPDPGVGGGQFVLILRGDCELDHLQASTRAVAFVVPTDPPVSLRGGAGGARVLLMQFAGGTASDAPRTRHRPG